MVMQSDDLEEAANTLISAGARLDLVDPGPPAVSTDSQSGVNAGDLPAPLQSMIRSVESGGGGSPAGNCVIS